MKQNSFHVGANISIEMVSSYDRIPATLVGWDEGAFIIAKSSQFKDLQLSSQDCCKVRFVKDGVAYGFQTYTLNMSYFPAPVLFLKYPEAVESMPLRKSKRLKTKMPAKVTKKNGKGNDSDSDAKILDLSATGCFIETVANRFMTTDESFYLTFMILDKNIEADCVVRNIRKADGRYFIGAEFNSIPPDKKE
ncbi:MAG TPA: hypothetical protein DHW81_07955, partial [Nitrospiraceae bacterium]|nr:hypothetical protein [Nitrospiraceae bacterium]